jgi:hypothetical protein
MRVTISLFDFSDMENPPPPLHVQLQYSEVDPDPLTFGPKKLTIAVGDDVAVGTVSLPLMVLTQLMSQLMSEDQKRSTGGLIGINKPGIILPN